MENCIFSLCKIVKGNSNNNCIERITDCRHSFRLSLLSYCLLLGKSKRERGRWRLVVFAYLIQSGQGAYFFSLGESPYSWLGQLSIDLMEKSYPKFWKFLWGENRIGSEAFFFPLAKEKRSRPKPWTTKNWSDNKYNHYCGYRKKVLSMCVPPAVLWTGKVQSQRMALDGILMFWEYQFEDGCCRTKEACWK